MKTIVVLAILIITILGYTTVPVAAAEMGLRRDLKLVSERNAQAKKVVGHVSVAGSDDGYCDSLGLEDSCDANISLSARLFADGTVRGQWQDTFKEKGITFQFHVEIDCLKFSSNKSVIIGGVLTKNSKEPNCVGGYVFAWAQDGNPDKYGYYYTDRCDEPESTCSDFDEDKFEKYDHFKGQVKVTYSG